MNEYELTYIVRPDADEDALAAITDRVAQVITTNGGQVLKTTMWGKRRLAYTIGRYQEGHYVLLRTELDDRAIREIERSLRISEDVFRHLLVRVEPAEAAELAAEEAAPAPAAAEPAAEEAAPAATEPEAAEPTEPTETE